ncbi:f2d0053b-2845-4e20-acca-a4efe87969a9-CDS [Sclerotinia trifoliorum]|uniref:F2d0053b-2845-4e20-acca-a4efe87969a9-CDS n=1 Tax=Sclerotinia trifoliorum TaxID=28548 RepID=A0A8H2VLM2_9HELO|nr:f2d0053b-2845-4e20-acca-a4efe87969a9-CDS [Sclerotinia trifoliorum]
MDAQQSLTILPYHEFQQLENITSIALYDHDGTTALYEKGEYGNALLCRIIQLNDASALNQYLLRNPMPGLAANLAIYTDPFYTATYYASTDCLRILLEHHAIHGTPAQFEAPNSTDYLLLNLASSRAHVDTARFLLNCQPAYVDIHVRKCDMTALLCAASSFTPHFLDTVPASSEPERNIRHHVARSEELMQLLLDQGACARDATNRANIHKTVLSLAISRASPGLVKRLIDEGADVHTKTTRELEFWSGYDEKLLQDFTPLHVASLYLNSEGIQVLLDSRSSSIDISDMLLCRDSSESIPLHWAAGSFNQPENEVWARDDIVAQATETIKLLLKGSNPSFINIPDKRGNTALHLASSGEAKSGSEHSFVARAIVKLLLEHGADVGLRNQTGQTPLHLVTRDTVLMELLLASGVGLNDADTDGDTALHFAASNLRYVEAVRFLISRGADLHARNSKGNTPLHEAAGGYYINDKRRLTSGSYRDGQTRWTSADLMRLQDEISGVFLNAGCDLDSQCNIAGKTPRMILKETRQKWEEREESWRKREQTKAGRGRGGGRGR